MSEPKLTKEEFCARFKTRMVQRAGETFADGGSIAEYADSTALTYFTEQYQDGDESPEELADSDMDYWED